MIKSFRCTIFVHQGIHVNSLIMDRHNYYIRMAVTRRQIKRLVTKTPDSLISLSLYTSTRANLRRVVQDNSFWPIQTSTFSNELLLHWKETSRLTAVTLCTKYSIRSVIDAVSPLIKGERRLNLNTIR
ncbi:hypothetical protein D3C75_1140700 [compost metagenome]